MTQTIVLLVPSVEVTKGEPHAFPGTLPAAVDGRWAGRSNAESREGEFATAKSNIRALVSPIRGCGLDNPDN